MIPERKSNRLARSRYLGRNIYFVTVCCDGRRRVFCDSLAASSVVENLKTVSESNSFLVHGYCVMPDHVHAIVEGARDESDLNEFVRVFKQVTAFHYKKEHGEQLWQKGYYDHVLRATDSLDAVLWYVWLNPVRAGLCADARSYAHSGSSNFDIALVWCTNGRCSKLDPIVPDIDVPFTYSQENPTPLSTPPSTNLTSEQITVIQRNALNALRIAYSPYNASVGKGELARHTIYVVGEHGPTGACGGTNSTSTSTSRVFYPENMAESQFALNIQSSQATESIVESIGEGIGNNGAHEVGHQIVSQFATSGKIVGGMGMDDNSVNTYNGAGCSGLDAPWVYLGVGPDGTSPIKWGTSAVQSLTNIFGLKKPKQ